MPKRSSPVPASILEADHATVMGIQTLADYQPTNAACSAPQLLQLGATLSQAVQAWVDAVNAANQARQVMIDTSHFYHDIVVDARTHVISQYGRDSAAVEIIGLTRKSQRRRPGKRQAKAQ